MEPARGAAADTAARDSGAPGGFALPVLLAAVFMTGLDFFIVNVAVPELQSELGATPAAIEWVVAGFALAYGAGLITGGRLGDRFGRRRMLVIGLAAFTATSVLCGAAPDAGTLVAGRALQGASAAILAPQALALLSTLFRGAARTRAMSLYGLTLGISAVSAQLVGGLLIRLDLLDLGWRLCFLVNLPIGAVAAAGALAALPRDGGRRRAPLDLPGGVLVTATLLALLLPLIEGREQGWPEWSWLLLAATIPLGLGYWAHQRRLTSRGGSPVIDLRILRDRALAAGLVTQLAFWAGQASYFVVLALYMQDGRGLSPLQAGLVFTGVAGGFLVASLAAGRISARLGRQVIAAGGLLRAVGCAVLLATVGAIGTAGSLLLLIPGLVIDGAGMGLALSPLASIVLGRVRPENAGAGAGLMSTTTQVGNMLGVALIALVFYGELPAGYGPAFAASLACFAAIGLAVAVLAQLIPPTREERSTPAAAREG